MPSGESPPPDQWLRYYSKWALGLSLFAFMPILGILAIILALLVLLKKEGGSGNDKERATKALLIALAWVPLSVIAYFVFLEANVFRNGAALIIVSVSAGIIAAIIYLLLTKKKSYTKKEHVRKAFRLAGIMGAITLITAVVLFVETEFRILRGPYRRTPHQQCRANLKQIGLAIHLYAWSYGGYVPPKLELLYPDYLSDKQILYCPSRKKKSGSDAASEYIYEVERGYIKTVNDDAGLIVAYDPPDVQGDNQVNSLHYNVLFLDGYVDYSVSREKLEALLKEQREKKGE